MNAKKSRTASEIFNLWVNSGRSTLAVVIMLGGFIWWGASNYQTNQNTVIEVVKATEKNTNKVDILEKDSIRNNLILENIQTEQKQMNRKFDAMDKKLDKIIDSLIKK